MVHDQCNLHLDETSIRDVRYKVLVITVQCQQPCRIEFCVNVAHCSLNSWKRVSVFQVLGVIRHLMDVTVSFHLVCESCVYH